MSKLLSAKRTTEYFLQLLGAVALAGYFSGIHLELRIFSAAALAIVWYGIYFFVRAARAQKGSAVALQTPPRDVAAVRVPRKARRDRSRAANDELLSALTNLGYSKRDALQAMMIQSSEPGITFDEQIRAALALLAPVKTNHVAVN